MTLRNESASGLDSGLPAVVVILPFPGARPSREFALLNSLKDTEHVDSTESVWGWNWIKLRIE